MSGPWYEEQGPNSKYVRQDMYNQIKDIKMNDLQSLCVDLLAKSFLELRQKTKSEELIAYAQILSDDLKQDFEKLTFEGSGCAISIASTSIMTEIVKGKSFESAKNLVNAFLNMIKSGSDLDINELSEDQKLKVMSLSGVKQYPMRVKCATLSWHTLESAMNGSNKKVNTETID